MSFIDCYRRWFAKAASTDFARNWLGPRIMSRLDLLSYRLTSRGVLTLWSKAYPMLLLTTVGRKTGRRRTVPLFFLRRGDTLLVVASNYGRPRHPGWSANLLERPLARVQVYERSWAVRARLLAAEEKAAIWPDLLELFDGWQQYEHETLRSIRVFALEPA